jgi:hypothetical protein
MSDAELLVNEFLIHGKKQGLDEKLLHEIIQHLLKNQFLPAGEREHVRIQLQKLIKNHLNGD